MRTSKIRPRTQTFADDLQLNSICKHSLRVLALHAPPALAGTAQQVLDRLANIERQLQNLSLTWSQLPDQTTAATGEGWDNSTRGGWDNSTRGGWHNSAWDDVDRGTRGGLDWRRPPEWPCRPFNVYSEACGLLFVWCMAQRLYLDCVKALGRPHTLQALPPLAAKLDPGRGYKPKGQAL